MPRPSAIYLRTLQLNNYKSFVGSCMFEFFSTEVDDKFQLPQCIVFLGDNGTGKTNILKAIANLQPQLVKIKDIGEENDNDEPIRDLHLSIEIETNVPAVKESPKVQFRPRVYERHENSDYSIYTDYVYYNGEVTKLSATNFKHYVKTSQVDKWETCSPYNIGYSAKANFVQYDSPLLSEVKIYGYGVNRFADNKRNLNSDDLVGTLFYHDVPLINLEEWLIQLEVASRDNKQGHKALRRIRQIKKSYLPVTSFHKCLDIGSL